MDFLGSKEELAKAIVPVLTLINLDLYVQHAANCPDLTCGFVISIDGTCKVFRECCGQPLNAENDDTDYDAGESLVQNAIANGFIRDTVCPETPSRGRKYGRRCRNCAGKEILQQCPTTQSDVAPVVEPSDTGSGRQLRSMATQPQRNVSPLAEPTEAIDVPDHVVADDLPPVDNVDDEETEEV